MTGPRYAELQVTSPFSFLRGASSAEELFATAAMMGIEALAVTDRNTLAGIVRAWEAAKATGVRLVVGCRLDLACGMALLVYPMDRAAYGRLCRLLTLGKFRAGDIRNCFADIAKARALLGFEPQHRLEDSLGPFVEWVRQSPATDNGSRMRQQLEERGLVT